MLLIKDARDFEDQPLLLYARGRAYRDAGQPDSAVAVLTRAAERYPGAKVSDHVRLMLAEMAQARGDHARALQWAVAAADTATKSRLAPYALKIAAESSLALGEPPQKALAYYKTILEIPAVALHHAGRRARAPSPSERRCRNDAPPPDGPRGPVLRVRCGGGSGRGAARLLVPMDDSQTDHLRAYGLTYWVLTHGEQGEWLLNYRGGSFLLPDDAATRARGERARRDDRADGRRRRGGDARRDRRQQHGVGALEKAPRVAVYIPPNTPPWDDAVTLALEYADIPYEPGVGRGGAARRAVEVRLAAPAPRGLHRPARQVLRRLPQLPLVPGGGARAEGDGRASSASRR